MIKSGLSATETIVCLANSQKNQGRCVAGKRLSDNSWIRPISDRPTHEISDWDRRCADGRLAELLDIIEIPRLDRRCHGHQTENILIDDSLEWKRLRRASWGELFSWVDSAQDLWENGFRSCHCFNNRVPLTRLDAQGGSLRFIKLDDMTLHTVLKAPEFGNRDLVVRASFLYHDHHYTLTFTDPGVKHACETKGLGTYPLHDIFACVSLSEQHTNKNGETFAYKLVASIINKARTNG